MKHLVVRWLVVLPTSLTIACGGRACGTASSGTPSTSPEVTESTTRDSMPSPDDLSVLLNGAAAIQGDIPTDSFDVQAVGRSLGNDPVQILDWVRTNTTWVPYRGALRGATGVLMDRMGNSLDRSLLLAELLRGAGRTVRLARSTLDTDRASALVAGAARMPAAAPLQDDPTRTARLLARAASAFHLDEAQLKKTAEDAILRSTASVQELTARIEAQTQFLIEQIGATTPSTANHDEARRITAAAADHWWVQSQTDTGWLNWDPMVAANISSIDAQQTFAYDKPVGTIPLPDEYTQDVTIRVVVEQWAAGRLTRAPALEYTFRPAESFGQPIVLQHVPLDWPSATKFLEAQDPAAAIKAAVAGQKEWMPILKIGTKVIGRATVAETGELNSRPATGAERVKNGISSGFGGGFDALGGGDEPAAPGKFTAEWIEYETRVPGEHKRIVTRTVFDLLSSRTGSSAASEPDIDAAGQSQRAHSLLGRVEILPVVARPTRAYVQMHRVASLVINRHSLISMSTKLGAGDLAGAIEQAEKLEPDAERLMNLALWRFDASWIARDVFVDSPNLFAYERRFADEGGRLTLQHGIDIVTNTVGVRPASGLRPFYSRLVQGIVDTNAEAMVMGGTPLGNAAVALGSTGVKSEWITARTTEEAATSGADWPASLRAHITDILRRGSIVVAPRTAGQPNRSAFWAINPATGDTLGIGHFGWGQATAEYVVITAVLISVAFLAVCTLALAHAEHVGRGAYAKECFWTWIGGPGIWMDAILALMKPPPLPPPPPNYRFSSSGTCGIRTVCR